MNEIKTWQFIDKNTSDEKVMSKFKENPPNVYGCGHLRYLQNVLDCIVSNKTIPVDGFEGRKSIELISAVYESAEIGKIVKVGGSTTKCKLGKRDGKLQDLPQYTAR